MQILLLGLYIIGAGYFFYKFVTIKEQESGFDINKTLSVVATMGFLFLAVKQITDFFA